MRSAALNTGPDIHLLDHIAPLAELKGMPLIFTEEKNSALAQRYYPQVQGIYLPDLELRLGAIAEQFDTLFECKYWAPHLKELFRNLYKKEMKLVFCPHGQSDKGFLLAPYAFQDRLLIYGELMVEMLKELGIWSSIVNYELIGNHRLRFYQKYREFYDSLAEEEVFSKLDSKRKTLLYAPTWRDADDSSSFFRYGAQVLSQLPSDWNLIVKLHPLLEQRDPSQFYSIIALADRKPNALVLSEFPPVYPILARADVYLGDASSVGYDFLLFQRPMFFFPAQRAGRLHSCGTKIDPTSPLYPQLERSARCAEEQKKLYEFAFGVFS